MTDDQAWQAHRDVTVWVEYMIPAEDRLTLEQVIVIFDAWEKKNISIIYNTIRDVTAKGWKLK